MTDKATSSTSSSTCSPPLDLSQARLERDLKWLDEQLRKHCGYFEEAPPYLAEPCRVVSLPVKGSASSDRLVALRSPLHGSVLRPPPGAAQPKDVGESGDE
jgi:hypothetical protein